MSEFKIKMIEIAMLVLACIIMIFAVVNKITSLSEAAETSGEPIVFETIHNPEKTSVQTTNEEPIYSSCISPDTEAVTEKSTSEETTEYVEPVVYFDVALGHYLQDHIFEECDKYGIDPAIVIAMIERESDFRPSLIGDKGNSYGLMQINKKWHLARMKRLGVTDLLNPYQNITVGIDYLAEMYEYGKTIEWALMAYNGGPSYARKLTAKGVVSAYAKGVLERSEELKLDRYLVK